MPPPTAPEGFHIWCALLWNDSDDRPRCLSYHHTQGPACYTHGLHAQQSDFTNKAFFFPWQDRGTEILGKKRSQAKRQHQDAVNALHANEPLKQWTSDLNPNVLKGCKHQRAFLQSGHRSDMQINIMFAHHCSSLWMFKTYRQPSRCCTKNTSWKKTPAWISWRTTVLQNHVGRGEVTDLEQKEMEKTRGRWTVLLQQQTRVTQLAWSRTTRWTGKLRKINRIWVSSNEAYGVNQEVKACNLMCLDNLEQALSSWYLGLGDLSNVCAKVDVAENKEQCLKAACAVIKHISPRHFQITDTIFGSWVSNPPLNIKQDNTLWRSYYHSSLLNTVMLYFWQWFSL